MEEQMYKNWKVDTVLDDNGVPSGLFVKLNHWRSLGHVMVIFPTHITGNISISKAHYGVAVKAVRDIGYDLDHETTYRIHSTVLAAWLHSTEIRFTAWANKKIDKFLDKILSPEFNKGWQER